MPCEVLFLVFPLRLIGALAAACVPALRPDWRARDQDFLSEAAHRLGPSGTAPERTAAYTDAVWFYWGLFSLMPLIMSGVLVGITTGFTEPTPTWLSAFMFSTCSLGLAPSAGAVVMMLCRVIPSARDERRWQQAGSPTEWQADPSALPARKDLVAGALCGGVLGLGALAVMLAGV